MLNWDLLPGITSYRVLVEARNPEGAVQGYWDSLVMGDSAPLPSIAAPRTVLRVAVLAGCDDIEGKRYLPKSMTVLIDRAATCAPVTASVLSSNGGWHQISWRGHPRVTGFQSERFSSNGLAGGSRSHSRDEPSLKLPSSTEPGMVAIVAICGVAKSRPQWITFP
jgi:hypothetical protein